MEKRRAILSAIYVFAFALLWMNLAPKLFPQFFAQPGPAAPPQNVAEREAVEEIQAAEEAESAEPEADLPENLANHPNRLVELGSLDPQSGYFLKVVLTTAGASVESVELNDPRYTSIENRQAPLKVVGNDPQVDENTLQLSLDAIDAQLEPFGTSLAEVDWKIEESSESKAIFSYTAPDGTLKVRKQYRLHEGDSENPDESVLGYLVDFSITVENLSDRARDIQYTLLGPVGVPLEDRNNSRTYVELKAGTLDDPADPEDISDISLTASALIKEQEKAQRRNDPGQLTLWRAPIKYIGTDVQYFAALVVPKENQLQDKYFELARPVVIQPEGESGEWSDISVELVSETLRLKPGADLTHDFEVFFGPKRSELMEPLGAGGVKALGWFSIVAQGMLSLLHFFHKVLLLPYGLAIVLLTVVVRACLFPISKKIAKNQQRMKELQPKMEELRKKYADNKEKQAEAYREFMAKHGFNPLAGCLPMFLQLPIFIGLYRALYVSVDLRMAEFLWIDNLAAPDQLFKLPFDLWIIGDHFNALPLIAMGLFFLQQKLFMPPPTSEEQALQFKMMNFFTLFLGLMFYRFPAGLCVYFITSSLWGICERKLLEKLGHTSTGPTTDTESGSEPDGDTRNKAGETPKPKPPGFLARLMEAADEAQRQNQKRQAEASAGNRRNPNRKGRKSKGRR